MDPMYINNYDANRSTSRLRGYRRSYNNNNNNNNNNNDSYGFVTGWRGRGRGRGRGRTRGRGRGRRGGRGGWMRGGRGGRGGSGFGGGGRGGDDTRYQTEHGRGRGGLPNETQQNMRQSGYGYIGSTATPFPRRQYKTNLNIINTEQSEEMDMNIPLTPKICTSTQSKYIKKKSEIIIVTEQQDNNNNDNNNNDADNNNDDNADNIIKVKRDGGSIKQYVSYACNLLRGSSNFNKGNNDKDRDAKQYDMVILKASGRSIGKAVNCVEVIKRKMYGLHQVTGLETIELTDYWQPLEIGLKEVVTTTYTTGIVIKLTYNDKLIDKEKPGYQQPISWIDLGDAREYLINKLRKENRTEIDKYKQEINDQQERIRDMKGRYDHMEEAMTDMKGKYDHMEEAMNSQTKNFNQQRQKFKILQVEYDDVFAKHERLKTENEQSSNIDDIINIEDIKEKEDEDILLNKNKNKEIKDKEIADNKEKKETENKWKKWDVNDVADFIVSLDKQRYTKYKQNLLKQLNEEGIDGSCLNQLNKEDLYRLGIKNFKDKRDIHEAIQKYTTKQ